MAYGIYLSADGAAAQSRRLEVLANNLANVDTAGFKRQLALFQARPAESVSQGKVSLGSGGIDDLGGGVLLTHTKTDFTPGPTRRTGVPTDLALAGEGFFVIERDGRQYLTRAGNFQLDSRGRLVTSHGDLVLSDNDRPITVSAEGPWEINASGELVQDETRTPLKISQPRDLNLLTPVGDNLFAASEAEMERRLNSSARQVRSGFLERSGVQPTTELMDLITASRAYEANLRVMQHQDGAVGTLISKVLQSA